MGLTDKLLERIASAVTTSSETLRADIAAGLAETRNALRITGARNVPVYPNTVLNAGRARIVGWSIRETTGSAPATVRLYDSRSADGDLLAVFTVAAGATSNHGLPGAGVSAVEAVFVAVTGAVEGSVYLGAVD